MKIIKKFSLFIILPCFIFASTPNNTEKVISVGWFIFDKQHYLPKVKSDISVNLSYSYRKGWNDCEIKGKRYVYGHLGYFQRQSNKKEKKESWCGAITIAYSGTIKLLGISIPTMSYADIYLHNTDPFISKEVKGYHSNIGGGIFIPLILRRNSIFRTPINIRLESFFSFIPLNIPSQLSLESYPFVFMLQSQLEIRYNVFSVMLNYLSQYHFVTGGSDFSLVLPLEIMFGVDLD